MKEMDRTEMVKQIRVSGSRDALFLATLLLPPFSSALLLPPSSFRADIGSHLHPFDWRGTRNLSLPVICNVPTKKSFRHGICGCGCEGTALSMDGVYGNERHSIMRHEAYSLLDFVSSVAFVIVT
ncbi:hypothetical protein GGR54DRAFT_308403 [Hypoxylon sp. NC1633]|nr:hypothetical protein GGR54DRAFT_308403 [Hypoxylon sp. NC1633]